MQITLIPIVLAGVALAVPFLAYARRKPRAFGVGLFVAAAIYVAFALAAGDLRAVLIEAVGVLLFGAIAARRSLAFLALGWALHVSWDVLWHPPYAPPWYPALCVGFDLAVAGYLLWTRRRSG